METQDKSPNEEENNRPAPAEDDEINLLDYLVVLVRHKKMILWTCGVTFVLACVVTLLMPNVYTSTAEIMPPQEQSGGLSSMLGSMGSLASLAGVSLGSSSGDLYVGMLQSRTVADAVIDRFHLMDEYEQDYRVKTYDKLADNVNIASDKDSGIISVSVDDEDPKQAAEMANFYVSELKKLNVKLNVSSAVREKTFLQNRLAKVKKDLAQAEDRLKDFKEKNQAVSIDDQTTAIIDNISQLKAQLAAEEVQFGVLRSYQTERNPEALKVKENIAQLKIQLSDLEKTPAGKKVAGDIFIPTSEVPDLGVQYARLLRDVKVQEAVYQMLVQQYEAAKINEARDTSTIQVLAEARAPDYKSKPKRALIVLLATFVMGFFAMLWAFIREYLEKMPEEDKERLNEIKQAVRFSFRKRKKAETEG